MKNEPLKNKLIEEELKDDEGMICNIQNGVLGIAKIKGFRYDEVKSAVDWLKDKIYKVRLKSHPISNNDLYKLIDEAFEDVK